MDIGLVLACRTNVSSLAFHFILHLFQHSKQSSCFSYSGMVDAESLNFVDEISHIDKVHPDQALQEDADQTDKAALHVAIFDGIA